MDQRPRYWFPAKRYGWGWGLPCAWQGWVVLGLFAVSIGLLAVLLPPARSPGAYFAATLVLCVVLVVICHWKGEPPRWRWGG